MKTRSRAVCDSNASTGPVRTQAPVASKQTAGKRQQRKRNIYEVHDDCVMNRVPKEVKCKILSYLSIIDICKMNLMCKEWKYTVECYLALITEISFENKEDANHNYATNMADAQLEALLRRCSLVKVIKGFHPAKIVENRGRGKKLTQTGVVKALEVLPNLKSIELSDFGLLTGLRLHLPSVTVPVFQNRNGVHPCLAKPSYMLFALSVQELELFGVTLSSLPSGLRVSKLHLQCVVFENPILRSTRFTLPCLKSFMMNYCRWPVEDFAQTNVSLCAGLASSRQLEVLHLTCASIDPRLIKRIIEANWQRCKPFSNLRKLILASNCSLVEDDIGALLIASQKSLEILYVQKTLSKDMVMIAIETAQPCFWSLKHLKLGYVDELSPRDLYVDSGDFHLGTDERPSQLSDNGMRAASSAFLSPDLISVSVNECAYLCNPVCWIPEQGFERSIWSTITEFTLSRCSTVNLAHFNKFIIELRSLKVLNLYQMFPPPPKGCSRVGLSAGMNIGGPSGIRAIISQPPVQAPSSLLSIPAFNENELQEMLTTKMADSDGEDTTERADVTQGYRVGQVHTSCTTTTERIRRSTMRSVQEHSRQMLPAPTPVIDLSRRRRRRRTAKSRASLRLKGKGPLPAANECPPVEENPGDGEVMELIVSIPRDRIKTAGSTNAECDVAAGEFSDTLPLAAGSSLAANSRSSRDSTTYTAECSSDSDKEMASPELTDNRCQFCGNTQQLIRSGPPPSNRVQIHRHPQNKGQSSGSSAINSFRPCKECIKKQSRDAQRLNLNPSVFETRPSETQHGDVSSWLVFDTLSGLGRLCSVPVPSTRQLSTNVHSRSNKGKAPIRQSAINKAKGQYNLGSEFGTASSIGTNSSTQSSLNSEVGEDEKPKALRRKRRRKVRNQGNEEGDAKMNRTPTLTADKETHTRDPFIEPDTVQVLALDGPLLYLQCVNIIQCGLTHMSLTGCSSLGAVTAHACPVLTEITFSTYPLCPNLARLSPNLARISQCPKMSLPKLLDNINNKDVVVDNYSSEYVRTIEFEPMKLYDREEILLELSAFPEVNKVLVECQQLENPRQCVQLKTYYENLLREMSSDGNASYFSNSEYRIYTDTECGREIIVSHNIPSCSTKITPYCRSSSHRSEGTCEVTSVQGHSLRGRTVLCFIYPVDHRKD